MANKNDSMHHKDGLFCTRLDDEENQWEFNYADCETQRDLKGDHNTWIIFGRDRPGGTGNFDISNSTALKGYGPKGDKKAGAINIVAGRMSKWNATDNEYLETKYDENKIPYKIKKAINNNFKDDASFVYISQKSDIDDYLEIPLNNGKPNQKGIAAIAIKSDDIRIVGRNSIKLVACLQSEPQLSTGIPRIDKSGIHLIAYNIQNKENNDMQPIPKGDNLLQAISELADHVFSLSGIVQGFAELQGEFNDKISNHLHISPFYGLNSSPSPQAIPAGKMAAFQAFNKVFIQNKFLTTNFFQYKMKFLNAGSNSYINSKYHKLN